jgi:hypothetical protein
MKPVAGTFTPAAAARKSARCVSRCIEFGSGVRR